MQIAIVSDTHSRTATIQQTLAVIAHAYPDGREQAKAIGIWAGIGSVALPVGPLLGGALTQALSWRAIFFLNVPLVGAALVVARRVVSETREPQGRRLDVPGAVLGAGALADDQSDRQKLTGSWELQSPAENIPATSWTFSETGNCPSLKPRSAKQACTCRLLG